MRVKRGARAVSRPPRRRNSPNPPTDSTFQKGDGTAGKLKSVNVRSLPTTPFDAKYSTAPTRLRQYYFSTASITRGRKTRRSESYEPTARSAPRSSNIDTCAPSSNPSARRDATAAPCLARRASSAVRCASGMCGSAASIASKNSPPLSTSLPFSTISCSASIETERSMRNSPARVRLSAARCAPVPKMFADRLRERAHVSPRGADDARARVARPVAVPSNKTPVLESYALKLAHAHAHGLALNLLAAPRQLVEFLTLDLLRRVHRRHLFNLAAQTRERRLQLLARDRRAVLHVYVRFLSSRARQVARVRVVPEPYRRLVLLLGARQELREPRRAPH